MSGQEKKSVTMQIIDAGKNHDVETLPGYFARQEAGEFVGKTDDQIRAIYMEEEHQQELQEGEDESIRATIRAEEQQNND